MTSNSSSSPASPRRSRAPSKFRAKVGRFSMSIQRSTRSVLTSAWLFVPVWLVACGGTTGKGNEPPSEIGPNTPYFVMPVQALDGTLPASVNDYGPQPLSNEDCAVPPGIEIALFDDYEGWLASQTYTYNDSTCEVMPVPLKDWQPASTAIPAEWGGKRCNSTRAMHLAGTYADWGA